MNRRFGNGLPFDDREAEFELVQDVLEKPLHWRRPRTVAVQLMGDLFHDDIDDEQLWCVWKAMREAADHTFLVLTKRSRWMSDYVGITQEIILEEPPLPNIWLGVTVCNQEEANEKIPELLQTPAAVHFVSIEPMLSTIDLTAYIMHQRDRAPGEAGPISDYGPALAWVIVGAETGARARPMHPDWVRSIRDQCQRTQVPFFLKQMTKRAPIPEDLMIREFPKERGKNSEER
jgi:protein gp37